MSSHWRIEVRATLQKRPTITRGADTSFLSERSPDLSSLALSPTTPSMAIVSSAATTNIAYRGSGSAISHEAR